MIILGQDLVIKKGEKVSWKDTAGKITVISYAGSKEQIESFFDLLMIQKKSATSNIGDISLDTTKIPASIDVVYLDDLQFETMDFGQDARGYMYEISTERQSSPIENNPYFKNVLSPNYIPLIKKSIEDGTAYLTDWSAINGNELKYNEYRDYLVNGITSYIEFLWNVRKTTCYAKLSDISASNNKVGQMVNVGSIGLSSKISTILPSGLNYLKCPPNVSMSKGIINVTQEFLGGSNWPENLYGGVEEEEN